MRILSYGVLLCLALSTFSACESQCDSCEDGFSCNPAMPEDKTCYQNCWADSQCAALASVSNCVSCQAGLCLNDEPSVCDPQNNGLSISVQSFGLTGGDDVELRLGNEILSVNAEGSQTFTTLFAGGDTYAVLLLSSPSDANCALDNASGVITENTLVNLICSRGLQNDVSIEGAEEGSELEFNRWVAFSGDGAPSGELGACGISDVRNECINLGLYRKFFVPHLDTCDPTTVVSDNLNLLRWKCTENSTGGVFYYSYDFLPGRGIGDALDLESLTPPVGFKEMSVTVSAEGSQALSSIPAAWWNNSVTVLDSGASDGDINVPYEIYVWDEFDDPMSTAADYAIVVVPKGKRWTVESAVDYVFEVNDLGVWLEGNFGSANVGGILVSGGGADRVTLNAVNVETSNLAGDFRSGLSANSVSDLRVQGSDFVCESEKAIATCATTTEPACVSLEGADAFSLQELSVEGGGRAGVWVSSATMGDIYRLRGQLSVCHGLKIEASQTTALRESVLARNQETGVTVLLGAAYLSDVTTSNNLGHGVHIDQPQDLNGPVVMSRVLSAYNKESGVFVDTATGFLLSGLTVVGNSGHGYLMQGPSSAILTQILAAQNGGPGIEVANTVGSPGPVHFYYAAFDNNDGDSSNTQVLLDGGTQKNGSFLFEEESGGDEGCTGACPTATVSNDAVNADDVFVGRLTGANANGDPQDVVTVIESWTDLTSLHRVFAPNETQWSSAQTGHCEPGGSGCVVVDLGLLASDNRVARSITNTLVFAVELEGSDIIVEAVEIFGDGIGDDDGYCEANEDCLRNQNFGAYAGHDGLRSATRTSSDIAVTTVTDVQFYVFNTNGF